MTTFVETVSKPGPAISAHGQIDTSASEVAQGPGVAPAGMRAAEAISFKDEVMFNSSVIDPKFLIKVNKDVTTPRLAAHNVVNTPLSSEVMADLSPSEVDESRR